MNRIYCSIFNAALGAWVAVPETAKARGKSNGSARTTRGSTRTPLLAYTALAVGMTMGGTASAQTWTGATDTDWATGTNWTGGTPAAADTADINTAAGNLPTLGSVTPGLTATNVSAGTLTISAGGELVSTAVNVSGTGAIQNAGAITGNVSVSDTGSLTNNGGSLSGSLSLNDSGSFRAATSGAIGNLSIGESATATISAAAGTTLTQAGSFSSGLSSDSITFGSATDTGRVVIAPTGGGVSSGLSINVAGGTLAGNNGNFGFLLNVISNTSVAAGATLDVGYSDIEVNRLGGAGTVINSSATDRVLTLRNTSTFAGAINDGATNNLSLVRHGAGTTTLTGASGYTGSTTVAQGTLALGTGSSLASTSVTIDAGAVLSTNGEHLADGTTLANNGQFTVAGAETIGEINGTGAVTLTDPGVLTIAGAATATISNTFYGTGGLTFTNAGGAHTLSGTNTHTGATTLEAGGLTLAGGAAIADIGAVVVNDGTLTLSDSETIGTLSGSGGAIQLGSNTLTVNATSGSADYAGAISGSGGLSKTGAGTLALSGTNTYTGDTTLTGGTVAINNAGALGADSGRVRLDGGTLLATETLTLGKAHLSTQSGTTSTIAAANGKTLTLTGNVNPIGSNSVLNFGAAGQEGIVVASNLSSAIASARVNVAGGTLRVGAGEFINSGLGFIAGTSVAGAATLDMAGLLVRINNLSGTGTVNSSAGTATLQTLGTSNFGGTIADGAGTSNLDVSSGVLTLSGGNTYTGTTLLSGGNLTLLGAGALVSTDITINAGRTLTTQGGAATGLASGTALSNSGVLALTGDEEIGSIAGSGAVNLGAHTLTTGGLNSSTALSGVVSGTGGLVKTGAGTLLLSGSNNYSGDTTISDGVLQGTTTSLQGDITNNAMLAFDQTTDGTFAGAVSGSGALRKLGSGTLILDGINSYSGNTLVSGGTLKVNNLSGSATGSSSVSIASGASLGGSGSIAGSVMVADGGRLAAGNSPGNLTLGELLLNNASVLDYELGSPSGTAGVDSDLITVTGDLTLDGILNISDLGGFDFAAGSGDTGSYRLLNYGGTLIDNVLSFGSGLLTGYNYSIDTATAGAVTLVADFTGLQFWDGNNTSADSVIAGGDGTWSAPSSNWTNQSGETNTVWESLTAVFAGAAGTVEVDGSHTVRGLQFATDGYLLTDTDSNGNLVLADAGADIRADSGISATIDIALSGNGSLSKTGAGTVTLQGDNTYTGDTMIFDGTLQLGGNERIADSSDLVINGGTFALNNFNETVANLSGIGGVIDYGDNGSGTLTVNQTVDGTYAGDFTGNNPNALSLTSALIKNGDATLTLSGTSTQTGNNSITVNAGRLAVAGGNAIADSYTVNGAGEFELLNDEAIGFISMGVGGKILLNDNTLTIRTGSGAVTLADNAAAISGSGNIVIDGNGRQKFSATSTYTGSTTINSGELVTDNTLALGNNSAVRVNSGGKLLLNDSLAIGSLAGSGEVNLSNLYGGHILLTGGDNTSTTFSGVLSGTGSLTKTGTGIFNLTGINSYSGGTTISDGVLQGTTTSLQGAISNSAQVSFDQAADGVYAGVMSGTGSLIKSGAGMLTLTGINSYSGSTLIDSGRLAVNGSIANSATTVNAGGTLGGSGTVGSISLNGGILAPGNSIGTLNVAGDLDFSAGGVFEVEVDAAGNNDRINATGSATLTNGTVRVLPEAGDYSVSTDYSILTAAGGLGGTSFNSVSSSLAFLTPTLSYDANSVVLNLRRNSSDYASVTGTTNQGSVGTALDTLASSGATGVDELLNNLNLLTADGANQAFDSLSGVQHTYSNQIALQSLNQFKGLLFDRLQGNNQFLATNGQLMLAYNDSGSMSDAGSQLLGSQPATDRGWWLRGTGSYGEFAGTRNASGAHYNASGTATGLDFNLDDALTLGAAFGYSSTGVGVAQGDLEVDSYQAAFYGRWLLDDGYYASGLAGLGYHDIDAKRRVSVGLASNTAKADYDAWTGNLAIEAGRKFALNASTQLTPLAGLEYAHINRASFTEKGAGAAALHVGSDRQDSLRSALGARLEHSWTSHNGSRIQPTIELVWIHEFMDNEAALRADFASAATTSFGVSGPELDRDRARLGLGLNMQISETASLNLGYQAEFAASDRRHDVSATFKMAW